MSDRHQALMDIAYDKWQKNRWSKKEFFLNLDAKERFAVHLGNLNYQVCNGGFMQWFDNRYGNDDSIEAIEYYCDEIGTETSKKVLQLVLEANKIHQAHIEEEDDEDDYCEYAESYPDSEYYAINEQFLVEIEAYIVKQGW